MPCNYVIILKRAYINFCVEMQKFTLIPPVNKNKPALDLEFIDNDYIHFSVITKTVLYSTQCVVVFVFYMTKKCNHFSFNCNS